MHELSLARGIVDVASEAVRAAGASRGITVRVRVGVLAGVAPEALAFCYEAAAAGTRLDGSRLVVEPAPLVLHCAACERDVERSDVRLTCPVCGTPTGDVRGGRELEVESVEVL